MAKHMDWERTKRNPNGYEAAVPDLRTQVLEARRKLGSARLAEVSRRQMQDLRDQQAATVVIDRRDLIRLRATRPA